MDKGEPLTDEELNMVYTWIDEVKLSRPKKNISRDFSDGLMAAEVIKNYFDKMVDLHNYPSSHNVKTKFTNWNTLNRKLFAKMNFQLTAEEIENIVN